MLPVLPAEALSGMLEIVCYFFGAVVAVTSYLVAAR